MTDFRWLTSDRLVQQTRFADGTRLVANFDTRPRRIDNRHLPPRSLCALFTEGEATCYEAARP